MTLYELRVAVAPEAVEEIDEALQEAGLLGWNLVEDVIVHTAAVVGLFASEEEARAAWAELVAACPQLSGAQPELRKIAEAEWREGYRAHFKAWQFGRLHWVPLWNKPQASSFGAGSLATSALALAARVEEGDKADDHTGFIVPEGHEVLWLDPGLAFGTGNHETTRLCVEQVVSFSERVSDLAVTRVIDAGCGSGILALSAAKLGFGSVVGFDNDPEAVRVSEENAVLNGLTGAVEFYEGDLVSGLAGRQAELVLANILAPVLIEFAQNLVEAVAPGGTLVLSGILASESEAVREAFVRAAPDWHFEESRVLGEWCDVVCEKPL